MQCTDLKGGAGIIPKEMVVFRETGVELKREKESWVTWNVVVWSGDNGGLKWEQELVMSNMEWGQWWFEMGTGVSNE